MATILGADTRHVVYLDIAHGRGTGPLRSAQRPGREPSPAMTSPDDDELVWLRTAEAMADRLQVLGARDFDMEVPTNAPVREASRDGRPARCCGGRPSDRTGHIQAIARPSTPCLRAIPTSRRRSCTACRPVR